MAPLRRLERIWNVNTRSARSSVLLFLTIIGLLVSAQNCRSVDGFYRTAPADTDRLYVQITEYKGRIYVQSEQFIQLKNAAQLEDLQANMKLDEEDLERLRRRQGGLLKAIKISDNRESAVLHYDRGATSKLVRDLNRAMPGLWAQLKHGLSFVSIQKPSQRTKAVHRFKILGPFIESVGEKQDGRPYCERFTFVVGTGSDFATSSKKSDRFGFRATAARHSALGVCGADLEDGRIYDASDSAFGGIFILDDDQKVVGILLLAYMYSEFFILEGYPPEKAVRFMRKESGTAESVYE